MKRESFAPVFELKLDQIETLLSPDFFLQEKRLRCIDSHFFRFNGLRRTDSFRNPWRAGES